MTDSSDARLMNERHDMDENNRRDGTARLATYDIIRPVEECYFFLTRLF